MDTLSPTTPWPFFSMFPVVCLAFNFPRTLLYRETATPFSHCSTALPATPGADNQVIYSAITHGRIGRMALAQQSFPKMK